MIVCHCEVVSDGAVGDAIDDGAGNIAQICALTGAGRECGGCVRTIKQILCEHVPDKTRSDLGVVSRAAG